MIDCNYLINLIKRLLLNTFKLVGIPTLNFKGGYQSGQMGRAVNPLTWSSKARIFPPTKLKKFNNIKSAISLDIAGSSMVER